MSFYSASYVGPPLDGDEEDDFQEPVQASQPRPATPEQAEALHRWLETHQAQPQPRQRRPSSNQRIVANLIKRHQRRLAEEAADGEAGKKKGGG